MDEGALGSRALGPQPTRATAAEVSGSRRHRSVLRAGPCGTSPPAVGRAATAHRASAGERRTVLLYCVAQESTRGQAVNQGAERHADDAGVPTDLDRARDGGPVGDLGDRHVQQRGRAREAVVGRRVQVRAGADYRYRQGLLDGLHAIRAGEGKGAGVLGFGERLGEIWQILLDREQHWTINPKILENLDLQRDCAGHIGGVTRDLAFALHRVHVAEVNPRARDLYRADDDGARASGVHVEVPIGLVLLQLLGCHRVAVRRANQEGAEVPRVVGVGDGRGWRGAYLA